MNSLLQRALALWCSLTRALDCLQPLAALAARLYMAQVFFLSGLTKLRDWETTLALSVVNAVAVISLGEMAPAALQQHVFWGSLLAGLAIYGLGPWSLDRWVAARLLRLEHS